MLEDKLSKLTQIYSQMLTTDVQEFEKQSQPVRMHRIDTLVQKATKAELNEGGDAKAISKDYVEFMQALDQLLETNGFVQFKANERMKNALEFFLDSPEQFVDYLDMYQELRTEAWNDILEGS
jgi:hypothetical protein